MTSDKSTGKTIITGSSRNTILGSPISAIATLNRRFIPPLKLPERTLAASESLTCASNSAATCEHELTIQWTGNRIRNKLAKSTAI